jgi:hypothetical protein
MARELRVLDTPTEFHQLDTVGDRVRLDLTDRSATVLVGDVAGTNTEIEITPTGPLAGDYFVGTFDGARMVGLVRLGEGYDTVARWTTSPWSRAAGRLRVCADRRSSGRGRAPPRDRERRASHPRGAPAPRRSRACSRLAKRAARPEPRPRLAPRPRPRPSRRPALPRAAARRRAWSQRSARRAASGPG